VKHILVRIFIIFCLVSTVSVACFGAESYTVQIAASKTPTDMRWFSARHNIELKMHELRGPLWYRYVIGQFEDRRQAYAYINQELADNELQSPFPRVMPDSLKDLISYIEIPAEVSSDGGIAKVEVIQVKDTATYHPENHSVMAVKDTTRVKEDTASYQKSNPAPPIQPYRSNYSAPEKYAPWASIIGLKQLHKAEIAVIKRMRSIMPQSWIPYYEKLVDRAIRYPIIMFFVFLILLFILNAIVIMIIL